MVDESDFEAGDEDEEAEDDEGADEGDLGGFLDGGALAGVGRLGVDEQGRGQHHEQQFKHELLRLEDGHQDLSEVTQAKAKQKEKETDPVVFTQTQRFLQYAIKHKQYSKQNENIHNG